MKANWQGIVVYCFLLFALCLLTQECKALDLERAIRDAAEYSQYELPPRMPHVIVVSSDEIDQIVPPLAGRSAYGYYVHGKHTVYLSGKLSNLDTVEAQGWATHEMAHYLQDLSGREFKTCFDRRLREVEAYHIQNEHLRAKGRAPQPFMARLYPCH